MIDKTEQNFLAGDDGQVIIQSMSSVLYQAGIPLVQTGPMQWGGRGSAASYGMVPKVAITLNPGQGGNYCSIRVGPDFETNAVVILLVAWLFFFPIAIVLLVLGYQDFQNRQAYLFQSLWSPLSNRIAAPPGASAWGSPPGMMPPPGGGWGAGQA
ncbi:MAG: hypothetical protein R3B13_23505 [Polyangiaceae bacterium]